MTLRRRDNALRLLGNIEVVEDFMDWDWVSCPETCARGV
jgi:hypothetical protein